MKTYVEHMDARDHPTAQILAFPVSLDEYVRRLAKNMRLKQLEAHEAWHEATEVTPDELTQFVKGVDIWDNENQCFLDREVTP